MRKTISRLLRVLCGLLSCLMVVPLCACGGRTADEPVSDGGTTPDAPSEPASVPDTAPAGQPTDAPTGPETEPVTEPETEPAELTWQPTPDGPGDFVMDVRADKKEFRILQVTDLQTIYLQGAAKGTLRRQQLQNAFFTDNIFDRDIRVYNYVRRAVAEAQPDMIILTGDNVYGETDDSGKLWDELIDLMNEIGLPWGFVFGNHDNESMKGVRWQIAEALERSPLCIFAQGTVHGNSNYSILLRQGGEYRFQLYMIDTNGCEEIPSNPGEGLDPDNPDHDLIADMGIWKDQREWYRDSAKAVNAAAGRTVPSLVFMHIALRAMNDELESRGIDMKYPMEMTEDGEFGVLTSKVSSIDNKNEFFDVMCDVGAIGAFFGHQHKNSASVISHGIRLTFGLKSSTDAAYTPESLGTTLITLDMDAQTMDVRHLYQEYTKNK